VLRRYFAGHSLVGDFLVEEAGRGGLLRGAALQRMLRTQAALFDRLLEAVSEEHARERRERPGTSEQQRAERIERLIAGQLVDTGRLEYDFDGSHLGALAAGPGAKDALRTLATALDCRLLAVSRDDETVWAWLGSRRELDLTELERLHSSSWPARVPLAVGDPGEGLGGWRLTHRQAKAALPIALRSPGKVVRYPSVALLASMLQDDLLVTSLHEIYLGPLKQERGEGELARETLRAYFAAGRNIASAAAMLGVSRQAVNNRLRTIENTLGRPLASCAAELEAALRLEELKAPPSAA